MAEGYSSRVAMALRVVELLTVTDRVSVRSVAEELGLSKSAAHRLLGELEGVGYAVRGDGGRGYSAGAALLRRSQLPLVDAATRFRLRPVLQDVRAQTGESVHVSILAGDQVLVVDGRRSEYALDIGLRVGMVAPASTMAAGKLLLAAFSDRVVDAILPPDPLPKRSRASLATREALFAALGEIRRSGSAHAHQESEPNVNSIAVPLDGTSWRERMALVVSVPLERGSRARLDELDATARTLVSDHASQGRISPWSFPQSRHRT